MAEEVYGTVGYMELQPNVPAVAIGVNKPPLDIILLSHIEPSTLSYLSVYEILM